MRVATNAFRWHVAAGYDWVTAAEADAPQGTSPEQMVAPAVPGIPFGGKRYAPLQDPALFRVFAATDPAPEGILAFATTFGLLTGGRPLLSPDRHRKSLGLHGERLDFWQAEVRSMHRAVEVLDLIQAGDLAGLAQRIEFLPLEEGPLLVTYAGGPEGEASRGTRAAAEWPKVEIMTGPEDSYAPGDLVGPALALVQDEVNRRLGGKAQVRLERDPECGRPRLALLPSDLLAAMWLQLARAIDADKRYRTCRVCGKWFEVSPEGARETRLTCSESCRSRSYRERQERARRLQEGGWQPKEIARELGTDVPTVRRWLKRAGK
jgi:hypothetical protein